ncbi:MAG: hypothetical protein DYH13_11020 [Alphaproteobacteria bacterium PRO2]|nr:hypothetical protein [Alphaproteobacteria bacterium PRO2]
MDVNLLFKEKWRELEALCNTQTDPYSMIKASAILRGFYFDDNPLINIVNKQKKLKIRYRVVPSPYSLSEIAGIKTTYQANSIVPADHPPAMTQIYTKDQFFSLPVLGYLGKEYTVQQLIKFGANVLGGVHYDPDPKRNPDYQTLLTLKDDIQTKMDFIEFKGINLPKIHILVPVSWIGKVTLEATSSLIIQ